MLTLPVRDFCCKAGRCGLGILVLTGLLLTAAHLPVVVGLDHTTIEVPDLQLYIPGHPFTHCSRSDARMFDENYLVQLSSKVNDFTIVSHPRRRATLFLASAAMQRTLGDFVETGVFLGSTSALMLLSLIQFDGCGRKHWAFDSFEGLPDIRTEDQTGGSNVGAKGQFQTSLEVFNENLRKVGALDQPERLMVRKGWFNETCNTPDIKQIAFLRLDGDLFQSTWDALVALYDKVSPGGYIYVDDYFAFNGCKKAVDLFREWRRIHEPLHAVREADNRMAEAVWWQKQGNQATFRALQRAQGNILESHYLQHGSGV